MFKDAIECYEAIGNALSDAATQHPWDRIVLDATMAEQHVDTVVACWQNNQTTPVAYLTRVPKLARFIYELARLVSTDEKGLFKKCTFVLHDTGKFDVEFVY